MFRPEANAARFTASAQRTAMPQLPPATFLESLRQIIRIDSQWVPRTEVGSLYLRPFAYATEVFLGVRPSLEYLYMVIASPVGPYFSGGVKPVSVWISREYTRAAPGGTGAAKCGGNYAAGLSAQAEAIEYGCDQVVYLDAVERTYVDELGGMNIVFVQDDGSLVTPPLTGTILPGITRDSILKLARRAGRRVEERAVSFDEWRDGAASGRIREAFACGTAAVITPIGTVRHPDGEFTVGSTVIMVEFRDDAQRVFAGRQCHKLRRDGASFRIVQKRVDNGRYKTNFKVIKAIVGDRRVARVVTALGSAVLIGYQQQSTDDDHDGEHRSQLRPLESQRMAEPLVRDDDHEKRGWAPFRRRSPLRGWSPLGRTVGRASRLGCVARRPPADQDDRHEGHDDLSVLIGDRRAGPERPHFRTAPRGRGFDDLPSHVKRVARIYGLLPSELVDAG